MFVVIIGLEFALALLLLLGWNLHQPYYCYLARICISLIIILGLKFASASFIVWGLEFASALHLYLGPMFSRQLYLGPMFLRQIDIRHFL